MAPAKARTLLLIAAFAALGGCARAPAGPPRLSEKQAAALAKALEGKVAGEPVTCVSRMGSYDGLRAISDTVLIYRVSSKLVYRNDVNGACTGISRGDTLVLKPFNNQYCRGDIANVVDLSTGTRGPSCVLGDFVPYRSPEK